MQKQSSKSESSRKIEQNRSCWKNFNYGQSQRSTVRVNSQWMTCADVAVWRHLGLTWQDAKRSRRVERVRRVGERGTGTWGSWWILTARGDAWRRVLVRKKLQPACGGACDAVSGRSWLGFARDWLFCLFMPFFWQLNEQNVDIRELQVLWTWWRWLASNSDYWMKARAAEEYRRCP